MGSNQRGTPIGEYVSLQRGTTYKGMLLDQPGPWLIGLGSIARNGGFKGQKLRTYGGPSAEKILLKPGDIYVSLKDITQSADLLGAVARVPSQIQIGRLTQDTVKLVFKSESAPSKLIYWTLRTPQYRSYCRSHSTGTTNLGLSRDDFLSYPIPKSTPFTNRAVVLLEQIEDKIELNRKMNATLEAMAQALFKSWFVDFDPVIDNALRANNPIPDELADRAEIRRQAIANGTANEAATKDFPAAFQETEELGWIPEGWEVSTIQDATEAIIDHRGKTPKKLGSDWAESGYPAVSAKNIKDGKLVRKDAIHFTNTELYERWMAQELDKGDVLMTSEAPLGEKFYLAKKFKWVLSQRLFALRANENLSGVYLYHWLDTEIAKSDIDGRASGTTVQGIRQSELRKVKVLAPSIPCITAFSKAADSLMEKRAINEENTEQLTKLRDSLLPKLISGELRVSETKQSTEI